MDNGFLEKFLAGVAGSIVEYSVVLRGGTKFGRVGGSLWYHRYVER